MDSLTCPTASRAPSSSEALTCAFLADYRQVLQHLQDQLARHNPGAVAHARAYASLILERLLFLTFLQETGWLGGDCNYLQHHFAAIHDPAQPDRAAFYPQIFIPLCRALSGREPQADCNLLSGQIPQLSPTVFDPEPDDLTIPDAALQPFFDHLLNRYPFTIYEVTPGAAKSAVEPVILGAIFENLTLSDRPNGEHRKITGSYSTPRAIVRLTCQQALQAYVSGRELTRDLLLRARIVDPAAGTGAFLVGMLNEMTGLIQRLDRDAPGQEHFAGQPDYAFQLKRRILQDCLFGVDIQPQAVRICRWRLWLSLLADYPHSPGRPAPRLPDLSQHIQHGDGLDGLHVWHTRFREIFEHRGGFDLCIGNPPYNARLPADRLPRLGQLYPTSAGEKNSAIMFMELASSLAPVGHVALVVPKSLTYSRGWAHIRQHISTGSRLVAITDASEAFYGVRLEQVIVVYRGPNVPPPGDTFACYHLVNGDLAFRQTSPARLIVELDGLPVHVSPAFYDIYCQMKADSIPLGTVAEIFRGLPWQSRLLPTPTGEAIPIRRGKQVQRYRLLSPVDYVVLTDAEASLDKVRRLRQPKILSQNIVAHVRQPRDRLIVMAALDEEQMLTLDTVENFVVRHAYRDQFSLKYLLAVLNSSLAAWFYYYLVYNRAVRTMHFDAYYAGKLPLKVPGPLRHQALTSLVDELIAEARQAPRSRLTPRGAEIYRALDDALFDLYMLTSQQRQLISDAIGTR